MSRQWQISAAELFEFARPAAWVLSAVVSTCVLASTRRHSFKSYWVAAWTLGTLFFPLIVLPLYLVALIRQRRREREAHQTESAAHDDGERTPRSRPAWRRGLPALYLMLVLCTVAIFFYLDYTSVDAHLWRANNAKLRGPHEKVIAEYRAALRLEDNAHTRKLLAIELAAAGRGEEALAEFRTAERMGEPDAHLPYYMALVLESLNRSEEAMLEYNRFLNGPLCTQALPDADCATARMRVAAVTPDQ